MLVVLQLSFRSERPLPCCYVVESLPLFFFMPRETAGWHALGDRGSASECLVPRRIVLHPVVVM